MPPPLLLLLLLLLHAVVVDLHGCSNATFPALASPVPDTNFSRAIASWDALEAHLGFNRTGRCTPPAGRWPCGLFLELLNTSVSLRTAPVWPHSQILHAAIDLALARASGTRNATALARVRSATTALSFYYRQHGYSPNVNETGPLGRYWDDNGVMALALLQAQLMGLSSMPGGESSGFDYLAMAADIFPFLARGQNLEEGGVYWHEGDPAPQRGLSATGSTTQAALWLHMLVTADLPSAESRNISSTMYGRFALRNMRFIDSRLRSGDLYYNSWFDNATDNHCGTPVGYPSNVCGWMFTYNQGMPIGAYVLLYRITGSVGYLANATATATAALSFFNEAALFTQQPPAFNAIFFRNLLALDAVAPDPRYRAALSLYLGRAWNEARDAVSGLFIHGGVATYELRQFGSIDQAAFVQMFAMEQWPRFQTQNLTLSHECTSH